MNHDTLEDWCQRAAQWMQEVIDDAQEATGDPTGETECTDGRALLCELDALIADGSDTDDCPFGALGEQITERTWPCPHCGGHNAHPDYGREFEVTGGEYMPGDEPAGMPLACWDCGARWIGQ